MVPGGWSPCGLRMTCFTGSRKLGCRMRRISCLVVFDQVTSDAGVGCGIVITIMTNNTVVGNGNVRASQHVVVVVDREGSRGPVWICGMTCSARSRDIDRRVIGIGRCIIIWKMTSFAGIGCIDIISLMACKAIVCNGGMCTSERIYVVMVKR